jgi:hypothetical protein
MANTSKLSRTDRNAKKRESRRALKAKWAGLTFQERREFHKAEKKFTVWLREQEAKKAATAG